MWHARDSDFRDERQSRVYPRLAGCVDLENTGKRGKAKADMIIPDLAQLTDKEFEQRLINLRNEHHMTLELCDKLGLHEKEKTNDWKNSLPIATVDDEYTLSTAAYADRSPARSPDFVRKNFKATKSPAFIRRAKSADVSVHRQLQEGIKNICHEADEKSISEYKLKRYLDGLDYARDVYRRTLTDKNGVPRHRCDDLIESMMETNGNMSQVKKNDWKHRVTIPKPFQMTLRETQKGSKTKAQVFWERENEKKDLKEMQECQNKFKAAPVPANVYIPLYDELQKKKARQRSENHLIRTEFLLSDQNPFSFIDREKRKKMGRLEKMKMLEDADRRRPDANFQAKPFPKEIFGDAVYAKMKDEEEMRMLRMELRAEEMLRSSTLPRNMTKKRKSHKCDMSGKCDQHRRASDGELQATSDSDTDQEDISNRQQQQAEKKFIQPRWPSTHLGASPLSRSLTDLVDSSMPATDSTHWKTTGKGAQRRSDQRANVVSSMSQQDPYGFDFDDPAIRDEEFTGYRDMNTGSRRYYDHDHQMYSDHFDRNYQHRPD